MSEFIGSRISLVSRSDIRYVGTLHEINSETSTVALENVSSFGTEGRKNNPDEEIAPSDNVYDYIVFRGSDVKDLRIEEVPAVKENKPPAVPNDPAILGSGPRPPPAQAPSQPPTTRQNQQGPPAPPQFSQHPQYPPRFYAPPPGQWGRGGPVPSPAYPGIPYGAPPAWYPPPGQGFPQGPQGPQGNIYPYGMPPGPPGQQYPQQQQQQPAPIGVTPNKQQVPGELSADKPAEPKSLSKTIVQVPISGPNKAPSSPGTSKPVTREIPVSQPHSSAPNAAVAVTVKAAPTGPKNTRIMPAVPLQSPNTTKTVPDTSTSNQTKAPTASSSTVANRTALDDATQAATAAVAAAMAKLPPLGEQQTNGSNSVDSVTKKVKEMKTDDHHIRAPRQPGGRGFGGHRGRGRGGHTHETAKFEVPAVDYDFETANAKFNKQDLVKEAIASSPLAEAPPKALEDGSNGSAIIPAVASYNKSSSFFDDLSSEIKDRAEGTDRPGGRVWRGEEQKKNLETFGQGSVDNGYRGGYRGRGRGRGGMRGRGYGGSGQPGIRSGRGGYRGRGDSQTVTQ